MLVRQECKCVLFNQRNVVNTYIANIYLISEIKNYCIFVECN